MEIDLFSQDQQHAVALSGAISKPLRSTHQRQTSPPTYHLYPIAVAEKHVSVRLARVSLPKCGTPPIRPHYRFDACRDHAIVSVASLPNPHYWSSESFGCQQHTKDRDYSCGTSSGCKVP